MLDRDPVTVFVLLRTLRRRRVRGTRSCQCRLSIWRIEFRSAWQNLLEGFPEQDLGQRKAENPRDELHAAQFQKTRGRERMSSVPLGALTRGQTSTDAG